MFLGGKDDEASAGSSKAEVMVAWKRSCPCWMAGSYQSACPEAEKDKIMMLHHLVTASLCISSWWYGYAKIGSLVMFLHDISDIPLDFVRLFGQLNMKNLQLVSFGATLLSWLLLAPVLVPAEVLYSIAFDSRVLLQSTNVVLAPAPGTRARESAVPVAAWYSWSFTLFGSGSC